MIVPVDEILKRIELFKDTPTLVHDLRDQMARQPQAPDLQHGKPMPVVDVLTYNGQLYLLQQIAINLEGMYDLLYSARHHLAVKALDGC